VVAIIRGALEQGAVFNSYETRPNFSFGRVFHFVGFENDAPDCGEASEIALQDRMQWRASFSRGKTFRLR
jgi:hypothetical protein